MNRPLAVLVLATALFALVAPRLAAEVTQAKGGGGLNPAGQPENFQEGKQAVYAVWHQDGKWNVRACSRTGQQDTFTGQITIAKGKIVSGEFQGLEVAEQTGGKGKKAKNTDRLWLSKDRRTLQFELKSIGRSDSFKFIVSPQATEIEFKILVNGTEAPERVVIGKTGQHPEKLPLILKANP